MTFSEFHGHFLTREDAAQVMHCAPAEVAARPDLLRIEGFFPGDELYPSLQFDHAGAPTPGMHELVEELRGRFGDFEIASFCTQPVLDLGGQTPIDWLRRGGPIERAARLALEAA
jgi:hypothetical protein